MEVWYYMGKVINVVFGTLNGKGYKMNINQVAEYFISNLEITPKKLQKLCYYAYVWYLTFNNQELFCNKFEAWEHGPVDPSLYNRFKHYKYRVIDQKFNVDLNEDIKEFLSFIIDKYGYLTAGELEDLSHIEEPWLKARKGLLSFQPSKNPLLRNDISTYYLKTYGDIRQKEIEFRNYIR